MSIRQGNKIISGGDRLPGWGTPLLSCMWADHKLNSVSWLRADTFSWQSGNIYISAYNHLVEDLHDSATTIHTEVISGNTITYYLTPDKHRICLGDQAQVVDAIYQATGISWYFILDEAKKRFKLPRTKWGFTGLRNGAGESIEAGLPNITGDIVVYTATGDNGSASGAFEKFDGTGRGESYKFNGNNQGYSFDASRSSSVYGKSTTVQPPATEMYLYFYVGNFDVNKDILDTAKLSELVNEFNITEFEAEVQESKNKAISEISTIYPEVAKYPGMVTNCITEIPQDIKLELNDGVLTLKAGSKLYVPNGAGVFEEVIVKSDLTLSDNWGTPNDKMMLFYVDGRITRLSQSRVVSGVTDPYTGTSSHTWYDTANNLIKWVNADGTTTTDKYSLPLCTFTAVGDNTNSVVSIDQVFNGFGYIGSTVFALPGVKGLIPNDRNADGTLSNTEFTVDSVKTIGYATAYNDYTISLSASSIGIWVAGRLVYDEQTNHNINTQNNSVQALTICGKVSCDGTRITSFETKTVFHAVDYNDTDFISYQAMPSKRYVDFTVLAHGSYYTAPADGYFVVALLTGGGVTSSSIGLRNGSNEIGNQTYISNTNGSYYASVPVSKGDKVQGFYYGQDTTKLTVRFVYANSAK